MAPENAATIQEALDEVGARLQRVQNQLRAMRHPFDEEELARGLAQAGVTLDDI